MRITLVIIIVNILCFSCIFNSNESSINSKSENARIVFYNVENLFDTINHVSFADEDFLPESEKEWNTQKYISKIDHLASVIFKLSLNGELPGIVGLVEVENKMVLKDLIAHPLLEQAKYKIIHEDSKDERGIDVALIYDSRIFKYKKYEKLNVQFADYPLDRTRDILFCHLSSFADEDLFVFVNHWPSRREGRTISEPKRIAAAKVLNSRIVKLNKQFSNPKIVIGGDFNDEPNDVSIRKILGAQASIDGNILKSDALINMASNPYKENRGTYYYWKDDDFNMLDQIILSNELLSDTSGMHCISKQMEIFDQDFLVYVDKKGNRLPSKTFGGRKYYNGYSDHFATYVDLKF